MAHHQFGAIVGDEDIGGVVNPRDSVLYEGLTVCGVIDLSRRQPGEADDQNLLPMLALQLQGRVNKSQDTVSVVYLLAVMDAGYISGMVTRAVEGLQNPVAISDYQQGFGMGLRGEHL